MQPKERPILFSGEMVRAILAGHKTMTRRVITPQPNVLRAEVSERGCPDLEVEWKGIRRAASGGSAVTLANLWESWAADRCSYGISRLYQPEGDRLYVRETWCAEQQFDHLPPSQIPEGSRIWYAADLPEETDEMGKWRPSIHICRWMSRITLEVVAVRVERLRQITVSDVRAEGVRCPEHDFDGGFCLGACCSLRDAWINLWDSINGKREGCSWDANPWVWVVEFRRLEANDAA